MPPTDAQSFARFTALCACPDVKGKQAFYLHDWERWNRAESDEATPARKRSQMTTFQACACHNSVSYGEISAARFAETVPGDAPTQSEKISVCQGLTEMHTASINQNSANELAVELGMTREALEARCQELCRVAMGRACISGRSTIATRMDRRLLSEAVTAR